MCENDGVCRGVLADRSRTLCTLRSLGYCVYTYMYTLHDCNTHAYSFLCVCEMLQYERGVALPLRVEHVGALLRTIALGWKKA